jgi:hypothetical protein
VDIAKEIKLINFIKKNIGRPFAWGICDCNVVALEAMDATYGTDLAGIIKGRYSSEAEAIEFMRNIEWKDWAEFLIEKGFIEGKKGFEQTGDLLIVSLPNFDLVHIYMGKSVMAVPLNMNVHTVPYAAMKQLDYRVWRKP